MPKGLTSIHWNPGIRQVLCNGSFVIRTSPVSTTNFLLAVNVMIGLEHTCSFSLFSNSSLLILQSPHSSVRYPPTGITFFKSPNFPNTPVRRFTAHTEVQSCSSVLVTLIHTSVPSRYKLPGAIEHIWQECSPLLSSILMPAPPQPLPRSCSSTSDCTHSGKSPGPPSMRTAIPGKLPP